MQYQDALSQQLKTRDRVSLLGHDSTFEIVAMRPEGVAVIRNLDPGYTMTSTVPLRKLARVGKED